MKNMTWMKNIRHWWKTWHWWKNIDKSKYFQSCLEVNIYLSIFLWSSFVSLFSFTDSSILFLHCSGVNTFYLHTGGNIKGTVRVISRDLVNTFYLHTGGNIKGTVRIISKDLVNTFYLHTGGNIKGTVRVISRDQVNTFNHWNPGAKLYSTHTVQNNAKKGLCAKWKILLYVKLCCMLSYFVY